MPDTVSFEKDILPLFTPTDIEHMNDKEIYLSDYAYMSNPDNATAVLDSVANGSMPPTWGGGGGAWPEEKVQLFAKWVEDGYQP
jgi:hypothetical protein